MTHIEILINQFLTQGKPYLDTLSESDIYALTSAMYLGRGFIDGSFELENLTPEFSRNFITPQIIRSAVDCKYSLSDKSTESLGLYFETFKNKAKENGISLDEF